MTEQEIRTMILGAVQDLVADFLYYGRKNDDELTQEVLDKALADGVVTYEDIVTTFIAELAEAMGEIEEA